LDLSLRRFDPSRLCQRRRKMRKGRYRIIRHDKSTFYVEKKGWFWWRTVSDYFGKDRFEPHLFVAFGDARRYIRGHRLGGPPPKVVYDTLTDSKVEPVEEWEDPPEEDGLVEVTP
jgi:hypothetical protein